MLIQIIEDELNYEKMLLSNLTSKNVNLSDLILIISSGNKFYYAAPGSAKRTYIRRSNRKLLKHIAGSRFIKEKIAALKQDVAALESILSRLKDYSDDAIISRLPATYSRAISYLRESGPTDGVIQSENPKDRKALVLTCSNGLKVRTKGELIIAEILIELGIPFRYEKALPLVEKIYQEDGSFKVRATTLYPDFTIFLNDGSELYWEHAGYYDDLPYRATQKRKFDVYYDNDIYPPKNLIITMDGNGKPIDAPAIRKIAKEFILPRC